MTGLRERTIAVHDFSHGDWRDDDFFDAGNFGRPMYAANPSTHDSETRIAERVEAMERIAVARARSEWRGLAWIAFLVGLSIGIPAGMAFAGFRGLDRAIAWEDRI